MHSSNKFMTLSLLNLYLAYIETRTESKDQVKPPAPRGYDMLYKALGKSKNNIDTAVVNDNTKSASEIKRVSKAIFGLLIFK